MKKSAIVIGIDNTERMQPLAGAVSGAKNFANWATSQQFHVELHTDEQKPVTFDQVYESLQKIIQSRKCQTLVIFFSGHGRWKGVGTETWLLSSPTRPGQGIEVYPSTLLATGCGIPHITFISDACRSVVTDPIILTASAQPLFTFMQSSVDTKIDLMFSCLPSEAAYETKPGKDGTKAFGVYTNLILEGLNGYVPEIKIPLRLRKGIRKMVVEGNSLHEYLWRTLPLELARRDPNTTQRPHSQISSRLPKHFLAEFQDDTYSTDPSNNTMLREDIVAYVTNPLERFNSIFYQDDLLHERKSLEKLLGVDPGFEPREYFDFKDKTNVIIPELFSMPQPGNLLVYDNSNVPDRQDYLLNIRRPSISTTLNGERFSEHLRVPIIEMPGLNTSIGLTENKNENLLLFPNDGSIILLPMLRDFVTKVWMRQGKTMHISFQPTMDNEKYNWYVDNYQLLEERISLMISVAHTGANGTLIGTNASELLADYLRQGKSYDPILGLYAAYMYAQAGLKKDVTSVYRYMLRESEPILFDVQMLAMALGVRESREQDDEMLRTGYPILTQGWQHISEQVKIFRPDLKPLSEQLIPGLWTTFKQNAQSLLF